MNKNQTGKILRDSWGQSKNSGEFLTLTPDLYQNFYSDPGILLRPLAEI